MQEWRTAFAPPGAAMSLGEGAVTGYVMDYSADEVSFEGDLDAPALAALGEPPAGTVRWVCVFGEGAGPAVHALLTRVPPLEREDLLAAGHRPKITGTHIAIARAVDWDEETQKVTLGHASVVRVSQMVITIMDREQPWIEGLRERIRDGVGLVRGRDAAYLFYVQLDGLVDTASGVPGHLALALDRIEDRIFAGRDDELILEDLHDLRSQAASLRRIMEALREEIRSARLDGSGLGSPELAPFAGDLADHIVMIADGCEARRDQGSAMVQIYSAVVGTRMNRVMRTLATISTIFVPLTFLAGIYGMNFVAMPGLGWRWGFVVAVAAMGAIAGAMLLLFRKWRWL